MPLCAPAKHHWRIRSPPRWRHRGVWSRAVITAATAPGPLLLQESSEAVRAEPSVEEDLAVLLCNPASQLGVDRDLALTRLRQVEPGQWCIVGMMEQEPAGAVHGAGVAVERRGGDP